MQDFLEILKILIPAGAVFAATFFIVKSFLNNEQRRRELEIRKSAYSTITPIRLQAYERIVIFLERLHPNNLVIRVNKQGMSAQQLHSELVQAIKSEYEHNLSQQVYMSAGAWELVKTAKEETMKLVNISNQKVPGNAKSQDLAHVILQITASVDKIPSQIALEFVKKEITRLF